MAGLISRPAARQSRPKSLRLGSDIEVHGICRVTLDRARVPYTISGFSMAFESPKSVVVRKAGGGGMGTRYAGPWFCSVYLPAQLFYGPRYCAARFKLKPSNFSYH